MINIYTGKKKRYVVILQSFVKDLDAREEDVFDRVRAACAFKLVSMPVIHGA